MNNIFTNGYFIDENDFEIVLVVPGPPAVLKNSKVIVMRGRRPILVPGARSVKWTKIAHKAFREQWPFDAPLSIDIDLHVKILTYAGTKHKRDLDNSFCGPLDALMPSDKAKWHGAIVDDSQVKSLDGSRILYDKESPRVEITISPMSNICDGNHPNMIPTSALQALAPTERLDAVDMITRNHERCIRELQIIRGKALSDRLKEINDEERTVPT